MKKRPHLPYLCAGALLLLASTFVNAQTLVVANKAEATASLIDLETGKVVHTLPTGDGPHEVAISPSGRQALITNYGKRGEPGSSLTLIDVPTAQVMKTIELKDYGRPHGAVWRDESHAVITAEANQALIVVDVESGKVVQAIATAQDISHMVALGVDGKRAFVANIGSGSITAVDLESGQRITNVPTGEGAEGIAVSHDDKQLWVTNRAADTISVLDASSLALLKQFPSEGFPIRATATPKGTVLVTHARAGDLGIYSVSELGEGKRIDLELEATAVEGRLFGDTFGNSSVPIGVVIDGNGSRAYIAHANADVITEIDLESGKTLRELRAGKEPDGMGYTPVVVGK